MSGLLKVMQGLPGVAAIGLMVRGSRRLGWLVAMLASSCALSFLISLAIVLVRAMLAEGEPRQTTIARLYEGWPVFMLFYVGLCGSVVATLALLAAGGWRLECGPAGSSGNVLRAASDEAQTPLDEIP